MKPEFVKIRIIDHVLSTKGSKEVRTLSIFFNLIFEFIIFLRKTDGKSKNLIKNVFTLNQLF